jgi:hypothetical protein
VAYIVANHFVTKKQVITSMGLRRFAWSALAAGALLAFSFGCSAVQPEPQPLAEEDPLELEKPQEEERVYPFTYPLTGLGTDVLVDERPVMVMVENSPPARPQSGLDKADIVYEILAEGEITRFVAVFQSQSPEVVGPVRSIRPYFVEIGDGLDALIVHAGWSPDAMKMLKDRKLAHFDEVYGDGAYYWRSSERKKPHNLYTSIGKIREGAEKKGYRQEWHGLDIPFAADGEKAAAAGDPAGEITIPYIQGYYVRYIYNEESKQYERYMLGEPHKDKESGELLKGANIIIGKARHQILDSAGRRDVDVLGPGEGYLAQRGKIRPVTWESRDGIIRVFDEQGGEIEWLPGTTWIHIIPQSSEVTYGQPPE